MAKRAGAGRGGARAGSNKTTGRIRIYALGEAADDPLVEQAREWLARTGPRYDPVLVPLPPAKRGKGADDDKVKALEAEVLLGASEGCARVALDAGGRQHTSEGFSEALERLLEKGRPVAFLIGGATGLAPRVRDEADQVWSLSSLTFPHRLALAVLAEQIYRAHEIARGGPYHK